MSEKDELIYMPPENFKEKFALLGADVDAELAALKAEIKAIKDRPPVTPGTDPVPPVVEPEPPKPAAGGLPTSVMYQWHHCWKGPLPWAGYPADVQDKLNFMVLGLAQSAGGGTGKLGYYNKFGGSLKPAIDAAFTKGKRTVMGFGGSSDGGITIQNDTQVQQAYDSFVGFVNSYGISGMDIDLEPSGSKWTESYLVKLVKKLKGTYPDFIVGITPGLYGEHTAKWMSLARALGNDYDYMAPMLYDFVEASDSRLTNVALDKCRVMREGGVPENKMILGFMSRPDPSYTNATPDPQITINAYNACKQRYPSLRGAFHWEDSIDASKNWAWTRRFKL